MEENLCLDVVGFDEQDLIPILNTSTTVEEIIANLSKQVDIGLGIETFDPKTQRLQGINIEDIMVLIAVPKNLPINLTEEDKCLLKYRIWQMLFGKKEPKFVDILSRLNMQFFQLSNPKTGKTLSCPIDTGKESYDRAVNKIIRYQKWYEDAILKLSDEYEDILPEIVNDVKELFNNNLPNPNRFLKWLIFTKAGLGYKVKMTLVDHKNIGISVVTGFDIDIDHIETNIKPKVVENQIFEYCQYRRAEIEDYKSRFLPKTPKKAKKAYHLQRALETGDILQVIQNFKSHFQSISYDYYPKDIRFGEGFFNSHIYTALEYAEIINQDQKHTLKGRSDIIIEMENYVYCLELKLDGDAETALKQIFDRQYLEPYRISGKTLIAIGINFSSKTKNIETYSETKIH